jgi:hypothetical protein
MPREFFSTNAPVSAVGSAAQRTSTEEDYSKPFIQSSGADYVGPRIRMVAGGPPVDGNDDYPRIVHAGESGGEKWPKDLSEDLSEDWRDWMDSGRAFEARLEARLENGHGSSRAPFLRAVDADGGGPQARVKKAKSYQGPRQTEKSEFRHPGLKKQNKKQIKLDMPPTPRGCEWRRSDDGMNLWRCWTEWDGDKAKRIKKSRYAGHLSEDAWRIMKEYDHEAFISTVGKRLRRHSGR